MAPAINTLSFYYATALPVEQVYLVDANRVNKSDSCTVGKTISRVLVLMGKTWKDVIAVATDSAE